MGVLESEDQGRQRSVAGQKQVNFLLGQCLKLLPTADPKVLRRLIEEKLEQLWST